MYFDFANKPERDCVKDMVHGYNISCAVSVAVRLGVADHIATDGPMPIDSLASRAKAHGPSLERILRLLIGAGIFARDAAGNYILTPRAEFLRTDHEQSIANEVLLFAGEQTYRAWSELFHCATTGTTGFGKHFGKPLFGYLADDAEAASRFHDGWAEISARVGTELDAALDLTEHSRVIDVGGGNGIVLACLMKQWSHLAGSVYDLACSLRGTKGVLEAYGVSDRCTIDVGDAMKVVPSGADLHLLKSVLHTCNDDESLQILMSCAAALEPNGKVIVLERVLEDGTAYTWGNVVDVAMLVMTGGKERTIAEYEALFQAAGLELTKHTALPSGFSAIEAQKK